MSKTEARGRTVLITSGKGGVGKTTATANIAVALAEHDPNLNICMVDMDIGLRNLDIQLGLENRIVYNLVDFIEGSCKIRQALVKDKKLPNLALLPSAQTRDKDSITADQAEELVNELRSMFDLILIDSPAGIEQGFRNSIAAADDAIIVCTPEMPSVRDADRVIGLIEAHPRKINCWLLINRLRREMVKSNDMMSIEDILGVLGIKLLGVVPEDDGIIVSANRGEPISSKRLENEKAGQAFRNVAKRLIGVEIELFNGISSDKRESFLLSLFRRLKSFFKF